MPMLADCEATAATSYAPYGEVLSQSGTSHTSYGYTGEQYDQTTGLLYLRARYYNPPLHAFTSRDPWEGDNLRPTTLHGYNYADNNPIRYTDPSGLCSYDWADPNYHPCWQLVRELSSHFPAWDLGKFDYERLLGFKDSLQYQNSSLDGISIAIGVQSFQLGAFGTVGAFELLYNLHTNQKTMFAVVGGSLGVPLGGITKDVATISAIYNIGTDNLQYSGDFHNLQVGLAAGGAGLSVGYAWAPNETHWFGDPDGVCSTSLTGQGGLGGTLTGGKTDYIPLFSVTSTERVLNHAYGPEIQIQVLESDLTITTHANGYMHDPNYPIQNGYISKYYKELYNKLAEYLETEDFR